MSVKRERDATEDLDAERACSRVSDEEADREGGTRKKLRLSKEQSALLEERFKENSSLNPKQKQALAKRLNLRPRQVEVWFQNRRARGRGRVEIVIPEAEAEVATRKRHGETKRRVESYKRVEGEISAGDLFIVPAGHPTALISSQNEGLNVLTFLINNEHSSLNMLTGKNCVLSEIKGDVLSVAMSEKQQTLEKVFEAQKDDLFVRGPREAQSWEIFSK